MSAKEDKSIDWTRPMLRRFKQEYREAVEAGDESFRFDGNEFLVSYAKYLIEFLDSKL